MSYLQHCLPNGLRLIHKPARSGVAHCGLIVNAGSRDETDQDQGLAHFLEHAVFKGTRKRKAYQVLSRMEHVGGEMNAHTTKEDTFLYASFTPKHYARWFELLADIMMSPGFPEKELQKEKEIVIDEINACKDNPAEMIFEEFDGMVFKGHPLGRSILGTPKTVRSLTRGALLDFMQKHYTGNQMVLASVGDVPFSRLIRWAQTYLGSIPSASSHPRRTGFEQYQPARQIRKRRNHQAHCIIGSQAYASGHGLKTAMVLLNNILGGPGLNARLNLGIREKYGFCYHIESHYQAFTDTGIFTLYFGTDNGYVDKTLMLIGKELRRLRDHRLGSLQMRRAQRQLQGQLAIAYESGLHEMLSMGKSLLMHDTVEHMEAIHRRIEGVSTSDLLEAANEVLDENRLSMLVYQRK